MSGTRSIASAGGAIVAAIASSACCWLPLLLMAFGLSIGSASAWFEQYRLIFLIVAGALLSLGFYSAYFAGRRCDPARNCDRRASRMQRVSRIMLWISAVFVTGFAAFPKYVGAFIGDNGASAVATGSDTVEFRIEGMTCEACTIHVKSELIKVPDVLGATVSYSEGNASISFDSEDPPATADLITAIEKAGYSGMVESENPPNHSP